ncbi:hypothetical protein ACWGGS_05125 [Streptomyces decoyicus]
MTHGIGPGHVPRGNDAALLAAGIADMAVSGLTTVLRGVRGLLGRADMGELADEGRQELTARGRLALDRFAAGSPAHLEVLAQHATARRGSADD